MAPNMALARPPLVVLAGGFGTRLRSAIGEVPKPMAPVRGRPFLDFLIENWVSQGVSEFILSLHHQADIIRGHYERALPAGVRSMRFVVEPKPLGTGGAVQYALEQLGLTGQFMVSNGDTFLSAGVSEVTYAGKPVIASVYAQDSNRYGSLVVDSNQRILEFREKDQRVAPGWVNAGLYGLDVATWRDAVVLGGFRDSFSIERDLFPIWVQQGMLGTIHLPNAEFIDIGVPEDYRRFQNLVTL